MTGLVFVLLCALGDEAFAQDDPAVRTAARELATQGAEAYDSGDYATALDRFARASELVAAPTLVVMQARSLVGLGRWVEAYEKYHTAARMPLAPDAPEPLQQAIRDAMRERADLEARLPRVEIRMQPLSPDVSIAVDGQPLPPALINVQHPIDPGAHQVVATVSGKPHFQVAIELTERQQLLVEIPPVPEQAARAPVAPPESMVERPVTKAPTAREPESTTPSWLPPVAFGAGGAGVGVAVVSGILAADRRARLVRVCDGKECPPEAQPDLDTFRLYKTLFYVGTAVGLVGLGTGTYFAVWGDDPDQGVAFDLGPGGASVSGRF